MKLVVSGKHVDVGDSLRGHIETSLKALISRFLNDVVEAHVVFSKDGHQFHCDLSVHVSRNFIVRTSAEDIDPYKSYELALDKMASRMTRYRSRLRNRKRHHDEIPENIIPAQKYVINGGAEDESEKDIPIIIAEMTSEIPTVTVSEAVMRMDLGEQPTLMFRNPANGQLNVVFRRADGNIGWIDPTLKS